MLTIRKEQMKAFQQIQIDQFIAKVVQHVQKTLPEQCAAMGNDGVAETVRYGLERANSHGFASERDCCNYVSLMLLFGRDFDADPGLPWASRTLNSPDAPGSLRIERLIALADLNRAQAGAPATPSTPVQSLPS